MAYPTVTMTKVAMIEAGIPFLRKSDAPMNRWPSLFSCVMLLNQCQCNAGDLDWAHAVMFGNPETGRPMPAEQMRAVAFKVSQIHVASRPSLSDSP